jgi:hypothetical protein
MRMARWAVAVVAASTVWGCFDSSTHPPAKAEPPADDRRPAADDVVKKSEHYRVLCHGLDAAVADASLESAEAAWRVVADLFPEAPVAPHAGALDVHVYRRFEEFKAACAARGYEQLAAERLNLAFADTLTAYVWFRPECDDVAMARIGVPWGHRRRVAHEAAHLAFFERFRAGASLPDWLKEGPAIHAENASIVAMGFPPDLARDPTSGGRIATCRRMRRLGVFPTASHVLLDRLGAMKRWDRMAVQWAFFRFLLDPVRLQRSRVVFDAARRMTPGQGGGDRLVAAARGAWGDDGFDALSDEFGAFVDTLSAEWDEWSGDLSVADARWIQTSDDGCAIAWREGDVGRPEYAIDGAFEIEPGRKGSMMMVLLGRTDARFLVVCFDGGRGVDVYDGVRGKTTADVQWNWMGGEKSDAPAIGVATRFEVRATKDAVQVKLGERDVLSVPLKGRDVTGPWGVGVSADALGIWDGVALH